MIDFLILYFNLLYGIKYNYDKIIDELNTLDERCRFQWVDSRLSELSPGDGDGKGGRDDEVLRC